MKKIISFIYIGIIFLFLTSCEDFLEKYPTDQIASDTFWKSEKDAEMALTGIYNVLSTHAAFNHGRMTWDGLSDIAWCGSVAEIARGVVEPTSGGIVYSIFRDCYVGISRCNIFLANIDKVEMDEQNKTRYKAEALFLRAHFYFILTKFYDGVPLYTKPVTIEEAKVKQSSREQVIAQVLSDLDQAITSLPNEAYLNGHAVKSSALAQKAQLFMHEERWAEAASLANEIIASGLFSLSNDYFNMFLPTGQDDNPEIILSVRNLCPTAPMPTTYNQNPDLMTIHSHNLSPMQKYIDEFECTDGLPINQSPLYDPQNQFQNRDPRLNYTAIDKDSFLAKAIPLGQSGESFKTEYSTEKYANWDNAPFSWATISDQDYLIFRYAQILLIYAECKNEASGPDQSVYDAVNLVRARPGVNMPPLPVGLDKTAMRERIRHERIVELGMEGLRYWDLKRWGTIETLIPLIQDYTGIFRVFDPSKHYLLPFPQSELDRNPNLVQNPGY